jgi:hypothetical protein
MDTDTNIVYRLNAADELVYVNEAWAEFASANDAPDILPERVLNRPLWDFVCDETTRHLYREILRRARAGLPASFNFRCDAPGRRRLMELNVSGLEGGAVRFETRTLRVDERPRQELLDRYVPRSGTMLRVCGWCKRMDIDSQRWGEVEEAVATLRLFEYNSLPPLTHGMCPPCFDAISEQIADRRSRL